MRNDTPRQIVRSRTSMSYALEAAVVAVVAAHTQGAVVAESRLRVAKTVADVLASARARKVPTWTVSKKERRR